MANRTTHRSLAGCLIVALLVSMFASIATTTNSICSFGEQTILIKNTNLQSASNAPEPCEEKEAKDGFEECQQGVSLPLPNETVFARLIANSLRVENHSVSSFGNTTNLPLYLAKCSFLI
jgi:hypothetical protein